MEFLSNKFTGNHLLKDSDLDEQESLQERRTEFEETSNVDGFKDKGFEKGILENSCNPLLSKHLEKDLSFENLEKLKFSLVEDSSVFSSRLGLFESKQDINHLFSSHFF